ncbi:MAG: hypothetical protein KIG65_06995 [Eubacteriales bacterium]|nr:hypothetical protein [Eubacteriales bacterium]
MKEKYIDLIETVFGAYTNEHIKEYTKDVFENGIKEHGYPRLTANLGILIAHGRKSELKDDFKKMMDFCCSNIPAALEKWGHIGEVGNDFSVKEIIFCLLEIERAEIFEKSVTDNWRNSLALINPYKAYRVIAEVPPKRIGNWAAFNAASEQLRKYAGIGDESSFIDNQIKSQLFSFDENGMYRDPDEPMVYDMVTRLQLALALHFGFDGEARIELENYLMKSADIILYMQSVSGEIPFGGRSNQFLHNEAFLAALCEYYASTFKKRGDLKRAGIFRRAAHIATQSIIPWLKCTQIHHVKNYYDINSMYGCEQYAHFNKYMITTASWLYCAYVLADDTIQKVYCSEKYGNFIWETSQYFHKLFGKFGHYYIEFDTNADTHYDSSGIGRIHRRGAPSAICLSVPFTEHPNYELDIANPSPLSICCGIKHGNDYIYACDESTEYTVVEKQISDNKLFVKLECVLGSGDVISEEVTISENGIEIAAAGQGDLRILLPAFEFDGEKHTIIHNTEDSVEIEYDDWVCRYTSDCITDTEELYANRNGHYKCFAANGKNSVSVKISIEQE